MILKSAVQDLSRTDKLAQDLFIRNLVFSVHRSISTATSDPAVQARVARLAADISRPRWTWDDVTTSATRNRQKPLKLHRAGEVTVFEIKVCEEYARRGFCDLEARRVLLVRTYQQPTPGSGGWQHLELKGKGRHSLVFGRKMERSGSQRVPLRGHINGGRTSKCCT